MNPIVNMTTFMGDAEVSCSNNKTVPWTYGQSFYFSVSIITTVGTFLMHHSRFVMKLSSDPFFSNLLGNLCILD